MVKITGASATHVGLRRSNNEDAFFVDDALGLFLVADGMGGAASGELASRLVIDTVADYFRRYVDAPLADGQRYDHYNADYSPRANTLLQAVHLANDLVYHQSHQGDQNQGMGSTLAALMADGEQVLTVHVGDSRVYLNRNAKLQRLTRDHRFNDDPKVKNMIEPDSTVINEMGNVLTRAMGIRRQVDPDVGLLLAEEGDAFLLASDGLTDMVEDQTIAKVLELDRSLGQKAQDLIDLALAGGGRDNVTVVLVETAPKSRLRGFFSKITKQN